MITCIIPLKRPEADSFITLDVVIQLLKNKLKIINPVDEISEILIIHNIPNLSRRFFDYKKSIIFINRNKYKVSNFNDFILKFVKLSSNATILFAFITTPLIMTETYNKAIYLYQQRNKIYDSLISVNRIKRYLLDENGAINFSQSNHILSENLPPLYMLINGFFIAEKKFVETWKYPWGKMPYKYLLNNIEALELRTEEDLKIYAYLKSGVPYV